MKKTDDEQELVLAVGLVVAERRRQLGLSQSELGRRSSLHRSYIGDLERGARSISIRNLSKIASALNLKASSLLSLAERVEFVDEEEID